VLSCGHVHTRGYCDAEFVAGLACAADAVAIMEARYQSSASGTWQAVGKV